MGDSYLERLFDAYDGRVPREADLVCYWFERAREQLDAGRVKRVGLVATQGIRFGANRKVLDRIVNEDAIFMAWSDRPWILDGAAVRVSLIGFDGGTETIRVLDGKEVVRINPDLTSGRDVTQTPRLAENLGIAFMGDSKGGPFEIPETLAKEMLDASNPLGRKNRDVVRRWAHGKDVTDRPGTHWIIDFGVDREEADAALYESPFEYVRSHVKPIRNKNRREQYKRKWWIHVEPRPKMRAAFARLKRYIATTRHSKHRTFVFFDKEILPDSALIAFARDDYFFFGVLQSRVHEVWAVRKASRIGVGNDPRYTPTTTFETFPFPHPSAGDRDAIEAAARALDEARESALAADQKLTLTAVYNKRPTWLTDRHAALDRAVIDAYGWEPGMTDEDILKRLVELNASREQA